MYPAVCLQQSPSLNTVFYKQPKESVGNTIPRFRYLLTCEPKKTPYAFCANARTTICTQTQVTSINKQGQADRRCYVRTP